MEDERKAKKSIRSIVVNMTDFRFLCPCGNLEKRDNFSLNNNNNDDDDHFHLLAVETPQRLLEWPARRLVFKVVWLLSAKHLLSSSSSSFRCVKVLLLLVVMTMKTDMNSIRVISVANVTRSVSLRSARRSS